VISQRLETIPGVSGVQISNVRYAMRLWIDPVKLASWLYTVAEVRAAPNECRITFW
jgi:multidrug efflux pump subunit AcrB